jgi:hypothetical protein
MIAKSDRMALAFEVMSMRLFLTWRRGRSEASKTRTNSNAGLLLVSPFTHLQFQSSKLIGLRGGFKARALFFHAQQNDKNGAEKCR